MSRSIAALALTLVAALNAEGPIYTIRTSAMEPTLLEGDHVLAPGGEQIGELRRGDVIAFHFPPDPTVVLVKRLIGLPGDHIHIKAGVLILNSRTVTEPYAMHFAGAKGSLFLSNFPEYADREAAISPEARKMLERYVTAGELVVPARAYFVLGDNRDYSSDSRLWGLVEDSQIIGLVHEIVSSDDPKTKAPRPNRVHVLLPRGSLK